MIAHPYLAPNMPFTFAHPAIILPLTRTKYTSASALIIGSLTPDFECFIRMKAKSFYSHTSAGILYFDLPIAIVVFLSWNLLIKKTIIPNLPAALQKRISNTPYKSPYNWPIIVVSLIIGICSHILWDSFTHTDGYFVKNMPLLSTQYHFIWTDKLYYWLRNVSSLLGIAFIIYVVKKQPSIFSTQNGSIWYWPLVSVFCLVAVCIRPVLHHDTLSYGDYFSTLVAGLFIGLIIASLIFKPKQQ
ncbi:MAG: DUF4184 family protein [Sphingobacteriales bacterium]|nr:MAG: DUF4184 family protein [Sphingobacteriales bacterium]